MSGSVRGVIVISGLLPQTRGALWALLDDLQDLQDLQNVDVAVYLSIPSILLILSNIFYITLRFEVDTEKTCFSF